MVPTCLVFAPGGRHILLGTKEGRIQLLDLASDTLLGDYEAHEASVTSVRVRPDGTGFVSGAEDKKILLWDFTVSEIYSSYILSTLYIIYIICNDSCMKKYH